MSQSQETSFDFEVDYYDLGCAVGSKMFLPEPFEWDLDECGLEVAAAYLNGLRDRQSEGISASSRLAELLELKKGKKPFYGITATGLYEQLNAKHASLPTIDNLNNLSLFVSGCSSALDGEIRVLRTLESQDLASWGEEESSLIELLANGTVSSFKRLLENSHLVCTNGSKKCFALGGGITLVHDEETLEIYSEILMALGHMAFSPDDDQCVHFLDESCSEFHEHDPGIVINSNRSAANPFLEYLEL